jgi:hypothetical protein
MAMLAALGAMLLPAGLLAAQNTAPSEQNSASADNSQNQVLVDPGVIYNQKQPGKWVGKTVTLKNVMVQDTNNSGNFWVGSDSSHRLLVVKPENNPTMSALRMHKGDVVTVSGTIQAASKYEAGKTGAEQGSMHDAENSSGVFLMADNVSITSSTQH